MIDDQHTRRLADELSDIAVTLSSKAWTWRGADVELRAALNGCLRKLRSAGLVAYFGDGPVALQHFVDGPDAPSGKAARELARQIVERLKTHLEEGTPACGYVREQVGPYTAVAGSCLGPSSGAQGQGGGFCALLYATRDLPETILDKIDAFHSATIGVIYQVLLHRVRMFSPFAPSASERYWDAAYPSLPGGAPRVEPPWMAIDKSLPTATLSLDLRKSTFCMENAHPPTKFARWLDELVQILTRVTHLYDGVFDKFTGDGALVHFVAADEQEQQVDAAVASAYDCAVAMQSAMRRHVDHLLTFLRFESTILGAAIGLDVAPTYWSLDHRNNPITVGRGVVNACRIGDKTGAGAIRLTNLFYQHLRRTRPVSAFRKVPFVSKEVPEEMQVTVWELAVGVPARMPLVYEVEAIVDAVYAGRSGGS